MAPWSGAAAEETIMKTAIIEDTSRVAKLEYELSNFRSMMEYVNRIPDDISLKNVEASGETFSLNNVLGGDHIIFLDFKRRYNLEARIDNALRNGRDNVAQRLEGCKDRVGVLLADASGHETTDALLTAMLHQAFLTGVLYELETQGHVTAKLFDILNTRFHKSSSVSKYLTMIYGEISEDGTFRFISAGHPKPLVFSAEYDRFVDIHPERMKNFLPVGLFRSENDIDEPPTSTPVPANKSYSVNEVSLMGRGDILLLYTDGISEHAKGECLYAPQHLEAAIRHAKNLSPREIVAAIREDAERFSTPQDDTSLVVIKKTT
jgi:serine phosphatase RsbU (regulator of sigma subunit)